MTIRKNSQLIGSRSAYLQALGFEPKPALCQKSALEVALDERARELDFYWKRTTYCWTLNAAVFAGYFALAKETSPKYESVGIVACLGLLSAAAWWCLNRGSKYWQENWELQVDLLETELHGPLHRINPDVSRYKFWKLNRAYPFSVTKVNQHLSLFVVSVWAALIADAVSHLEWSHKVGSPLLGIIIIFTFVGCVVFGKYGVSTPHHSVLGKTVFLKFEPVDADPEEVPKT